jgi:hypothetical protein
MIHNRMQKIKIFEVASDSNTDHINIRKLLDLNSRYTGNQNHHTGDPAEHTGRFFHK